MRTFFPFESSIWQVQSMFSDSAHRLQLADGTIPRPVKIGGMSRWSKSEIDAVIDRAKAQREG